MLKSLTAATLMGAVALGGLAQAQTAPAPRPAPVQPMKADADGDGRITRAEFLARAEARFARLDTNRDGVVTREERRAGKTQKRHRGAGAMGGPFIPAQEAAPPRAGGPRGPGGGLARMDADGDGRVTRAEFDAASAARFDRMDTNRDGRVDATELAALPGGGRGMRADTDGNGVLTRAEHEAMARQRFERIDVNRDGVLDAAELQAGIPMRGRRGGGERRMGPPRAPRAPATPTGA